MHGIARGIDQEERLAGQGYVTKYVTISDTCFSFRLATYRMCNSLPLNNFVELAPKDLLGLNGAEAVVGFFAKLGYDTSSCTNQSPANLGIPEVVARPIERIELVADHQKLLQGCRRQVVRQRSAKPVETRASSWFQ